MARQLVALRQATITDAADAFLARPMPATTRRSYSQTMGCLVAGRGLMRDAGAGTSSAEGAADDHLLGDLRLRSAIIESDFC